MTTKAKTDDAGTKPADEKQTATERFTKERLEADLQRLQGQLAHAEQNLQRASAAVTEWQGRGQAIIGAISYCAELLKSYGVETPPVPNTKPVESKSTRKRKAIQQGNGKLPPGTSAADLQPASGSAAPKVE